MTEKYDNFDTYIIYVEDGKQIRLDEPVSTTEDDFFHEVSKALCFADCSGIEIEKIVFRGKEYFYKGWQPNMLYEFTDENDRTFWSDCFPEWEH